LHWDTSLLPLTPRAALWADRVLEGGKLVACVSNQFTQLYFHYGFFRYDVAIEVRVEFEATIRIADKSGKRRFRVATLKARMKPSYPTGDMKGERPATITGLWNGAQPMGVSWGPMQGNLDRLFFVMQDPVAQRDLVELSNLLREEITSRRVRQVAKRQ
jgi:hypothetical protein